MNCGSEEEEYPGQGLLLQIAFDRSEEAVEGDRFEQVVDNVEVEGVQRVFPVGRCEDGMRGVAQAFEEVESGELGHADVEEEEVDGLVVENFQGFYGIGAYSADLEEGQLPDMFLQQLYGERFVVNEQAADIHEAGFRLRVRRAVNWSFSLLIENV